MHPRDLTANAPGCLVMRLRDPHAKPGDLPVWWCVLWYGRGLPVYSRACEGSAPPSLTDLVVGHKDQPGSWTESHPCTQPSTF